MTPTNQNCICTEISNWLYSENVCCHSVQNILSSCLLFRDSKCMEL